MDTNIQKKYLTPPELARELGVGTNKVLFWIESGELRAINVATSRKNRPRWAIEPEEIERFKASRSSAPQPKQAPRKSRTPDGVKEYF